MARQSRASPGELLVPGSFPATDELTDEFITQTKPLAPYRADHVKLRLRTYLRGRRVKLLDVFAVVTNRDATGNRIAYRYRVAILGRAQALGLIHFRDFAVSLHKKIWRSTNYVHPSSGRRYGFYQKSQSPLTLLMLDRIRFAAGATAGGGWQSAPPGSLSSNTNARGAPPSYSQPLVRQRV
ncbi:hypothetical protein EVAR_51905_1 [Eumeta japonica]|uniref:Uncharacterized protein n=1 Tax=Eumeta variegata TaxID=151549 RepID=A0A4C1XK27_EUMVA|nr:hypothetical protein EVAR_51905_1 [Eumeta japonica]